MDGRIVCCGCY